jgi:intracellular septation protein
MDFAGPNIDNSAPMKFLFDLFPVILFFIAFKVWDIYAATAVAIAASFVQIGWVWFRHRKVDNMLWVGLVVIVVFGGATLAFHDNTFIRWKPTVLYWLFCAALLVASLGFRKNLIKSMMKEQIALPEAAWNKLLASWIGFFAFMGAANLYVAFSFSESFCSNVIDAAAREKCIENVWVNFKLFGFMGLMLVFVVLQALMLSKYVIDKDAE